MRIHLPNSAFLGNIDSFIQGFDPSEPDHLEITANDKWISVHPAVLSMIAALGVSLKPENIHCQPFEATSRGYFVRMGLFRMLGIDPGISIREHEASGRFIPLVRIRTSDELTHFISEMVPLLHLDTGPSQTLCYIVSELARNVLEHAGAPSGAILCAQYYQKSNSLRIGIADTGVGIQGTISHFHPVTTDLEAIRFALMPGITGTTSREGGTEQNAGAGLFFIKSIASVNRDFLMLYSGSGLYKLLKKRTARRPPLHADPFADRHSGSNVMPRWQGTVAGVDISLDQTEAFSLLLEDIRETYRLAIRERRQERFKRPRFI